MIDTLIFDFDGVIIDTETPDFETWNEVFQAHGVALELSWWAQFIGGIGGNSGVFQLLEGLTGRLVDREKVQRLRRQSYLDIIEANPLLPGILDYIEEARQLGLKLGIASSSSRSWVEGHLGRRGILQRFESINCADDVSRVKPAPDLYLRSVSQIGTRPENAVAIEDSANGVTAAKAAGMFCVVVPNPMTRDLAVDHADLRLESLADMDLRSLLSRFP